MSTVWYVFPTSTSFTSWVDDRSMFFPMGMSLGDGLPARRPIAVSETGLSVPNCMLVSGMSFWNDGFVTGPVTPSTFVKISAWASHVTRGTSAAAANAITSAAFSNISHLGTGTISYQTSWG